MRATTLLTLLTPLSFAYAQQNPFNVPPTGYTSMTAGSPLPLSWHPTTPGPITLILRSGDAANLAEGTLIASNVDNTGSYMWDVPRDLTRGAAYTVQIVAGDGVGGGEVNYTPYFAIDSSNTTPSSTSLIPTGAPSGSAALPAVPSSLAAQQSSITALARSTGSVESTGAMSSSAAAGAMSTATGSATMMSGSSGSSSTMSGGSAAATTSTSGAGTRGGAVGLALLVGVLAAGVVL